MNKAKLLAALLACGLFGGCAAMNGEHNDKDKDNEGDEVKVKFDDLPAPVRATFAEQAPGTKIDTVDKETKMGATVYEADAMLNGTNYEIKVAEDGKLIGKKIDKEEDEDKDKKDTDKKDSDKK